MIIITTTYPPVPRQLPNPPQHVDSNLLRIASSQVITTTYPPVPLLLPNPPQHVDSNLLRLASSQVITTTYPPVPLLLPNPPQHVDSNLLRLAFSWGLIVTVYPEAKPLAAHRGGMYVLSMIDWYAGSISVILICIVEVVIVGWIYGE
uniref:Uncharacterized protein n=1 Tax=Timema shepardi TaxID=629360 RepID=A0A7R9B964_TIMSH|nr:unnamed protein product [Timema shepardi]